MRDWNLRKTSTILVIKTTWTLLENFRVQSMKRAYPVTTTSLWLPQPGTDAHNPILIHLKPSDMEWKEKRSYNMHPAKKQQREEIRKDMEGYSNKKSNKRKGQGLW